MSYKTYSAWDRTTRFFHWINFLCVTALAVFGLLILNGDAFGVSAEGKVLLKTLHVYVGYVLAANLAWRIVWAFVGNPRARWRALLPAGRGYVASLFGYLRGLRGDHPPVYLGHNPLGRIMVTLLLLLLASQAVTGLVLAGTDLYKPPFGGYIAEWVTAGDPDKLARLQPGSRDHVDPDAYADMRDFRKPFITLHLYVFYALLAGVGLHVAGVISGEIRERHGLVSAMFSGEKFLSEVPVDADPDEKSALCGEQGVTTRDRQDGSA